MNRMLHQLKRVLSSVRYHHCTAVPLEHRALIRVHGNDTNKFLQGLITNDVEFLKSTNSIYAMLLNARGRILYDMLIYNPDRSDSSLLIEISLSAVNDFQRILRTYKLRKQVQIEDVTSEYRIWSIFSTMENDLQQSLQLKNRDGLLMGQSDPRHSSLGVRLITKRSHTINNLTDICKIENDLTVYKRWLYKNGIAEGVEDITPGEFIPLEFNVVFLNGVSFSKGCYIGQELVARTHHTGVIRKRLMPINIENYDKFQEKSNDLTIVNCETKRRAGKLRTSIDQYGIGLIRLSEWKNSLRIENGNIQIRPSIPHWWPKLDEATQLEMKLDTNPTDS